MIAEAKRDEFALAADDAIRWRAEFTTPADRRPMWAGVAEWAKNLLARARQGPERRGRKR